VREIREAPGGNDVCGFDVGLLNLSDTVAAAEATPLVPRVDLAPQTSELYDAAGYGAVCADPPDSDTCALQAGIRRRVGNQRLACLGLDCPFPILTATEWIGAKDVCEGDSGGPALDTQGRVIGVASRGSDTDGGCQTPIYSRVDSWKDFLTQAVLDGSKIGGYTPPSWATTGNTDAGTTTPPVAKPEPSLEAGSAPDAVTPALGATGSACTTSEQCIEPLLCVPVGPGYCAPTCSSSIQVCPANYVCDPAAGVCIQDSLQSTTPPEQNGDSSGGGCAVGGLGRAGGTSRSRGLVGIASVALFSLAHWRKRRHLR
jgi:hypothetical protein